MSTWSWTVKNKVVWTLLLVALLHEVIRSATLLRSMDTGMASLVISSPSITVTTQGGGATQNSFLDSWEQNTAVVSISFGNATSTNLLERLVYSLRTNGQWHGPILILTDQAKEYEDRFRILSPLLIPNTHIIQAKPDHLHPIDPETGKPLEFITEAMRFKRFKTLILEYLDEYYRLPLEHVLYLDVEIVVARPLVGLLQDYRDQMIQRLVFGLDGSINTTLPFMSHFSDCAKCGRQNFHLNGGVFLLQTRYSRACLVEWNSLFAQGATYARADQRYLVVMKSSQSCKFYQLPDVHRLYPTRRDMRLKVSATIVHNTNTYQAQHIPYHVQQPYFAYLLGNVTFLDSQQLQLF